MLRAEKQQAAPCSAHHMTLLNTRRTATLATADATAAKARASPKGCVWVTLGESNHSHTKDFLWAKPSTVLDVVRSQPTVNANVRHDNMLLTEPD